jgi:serine/threonine protein kinase
MLGPYRLRELLGEGGMGRVYLAAGPDNQPVAVKVLRQGAPGEENARRRLAREVDTMRRVHSPFVAEVLGADVDGDPPYIVTQYVAGRTLEDIVTTDGPLSGPALASLACGLSAAIAAIHAAGVVHRDLKPANVMLVGGEPVVIDFGIAQSPDSTRLTMTGMFMGTPGYLAPEVIEGTESSAAADVHSWAATVAYAATGRPPFGSGQFQAIFYRIVHGQADLDTLPEPLRPVILAGLARDPANRPTAAQLVSLLAAISPETLVPAAASTAPVGAALAGGSSAYQPPWQLAGTAVDLPPAGSVRPAASPVWTGTRPLVVPGREDYGDLLPPVHYQPVAEPARQRGTPPGSGSQRTPGSPVPSRSLLVLATMLSLVGLSVLFPIAGVAAVLGSLILLRATDLTVSRLASRQGNQHSAWASAVSSAAFYPWAVLRSVVRFVFLAPMALLCAAAATVITVLAAGAAELPRAVSYAAGALVACYCLGPGSIACRRPLGRFYGHVTRSAPAAALGTVALAVVAVAATTAAVRVTPGYWPAAHVGTQLHTVATSHPGISSVAGVGSRFWHWISGRIP